MYTQLRARCDDEAALLLAMMRLGADVDKMVALLRSAPDLSWAKGKNALEIVLSQLLANDHGFVGV